MLQGLTMLLGTLQSHFHPFLGELILFLSPPQGLRIQRPVRCRSLC